MRKSITPSRSCDKAAAESAADTPHRTSNPGRPLEKSPDNMWAHSVKHVAIPGSSGELVPWEDMPVKEDNSKRLAAQREWQKHRDPQASERFCQETVKDYKSFAIRKIAGSGRNVETFIPTFDRPIPSDPYGVAQYDKWDNAYWAEQKKNRESGPEYHAKENNCHVMDEAQGL
ncbi:MAG: hypothetical protein EOP04_03765 [Proteobacteria bacterium]|nr:MAG: hypothetical protein EOP04_03765 [Pseudomonadota bacterium]